MRNVIITIVLFIMAGCSDDGASGPDHGVATDAAADMGPPLSLGTGKCSVAAGMKTSVQVRINRALLAPKAIHVDVQNQNPAVASLSYMGKKDKMLVLSYAPTETTKNVSVMGLGAGTAKVTFSIRGTTVSQVLEVEVKAPR